jgi:hypothetical protein
MYGSSWNRVRVQLSPHPLEAGLEVIASSIGRPRRDKARLGYVPAAADGNELTVI